MAVPPRKMNAEPITHSSSILESMFFSLFTVILHLARAWMHGRFRLSSDVPHVEAVSLFPQSSSTYIDPTNAQRPRYHSAQPAHPGICHAAHAINTHTLDRHWRLRKAEDLASTAVLDKSEPHRGPFHYCPHDITNPRRKCCATFDKYSTNFPC